MDKYGETNYCVIHWIVIYPVDSTIQHLNNWAQQFQLLKYLSDCDFLACVAGNLFGVFFSFLFHGVRDSATPKLNQGWKRKRGEKAVRKTTCNQPAEIFETASAFRMKQMTFLIGQQNVNLPADVRFPASGYKL